MSGEDPSEMAILNPAGYGVILTKEQSACVNFSGEKTNLVVKGYAGSGKSLALMGRATKYLEKYYVAGKRNGMAYFSHTNSLVSYAKENLDPDDQKKEFIKITTLDSHKS